MHFEETEDEVSSAATEEETEDETPLLLLSRDSFAAAGFSRVLPSSRCEVAFSSVLLSASPALLSLSLLETVMSDTIGLLGNVAWSPTPLLTSDTILTTLFCL